MVGGPKGPEKMGRPLWMFPKYNFINAFALICLLDPFMISASTKITEFLSELCIVGGHPFSSQTEEKNIYMMTTEALKISKCNTRCFRLQSLGMVSKI